MKNLQIGEIRGDMVRLCLFYFGISVVSVYI